MKTRLISLLYAGCARADRRLSAAMLPWLLREIAANGTQERLSVTVEDGCLKAYNANFEPVFLHRLVDILRVSQPRGRPHELYYVMLDPELGLRVHLFLAASGQEVSELFVQMREASPGGEGGGGGPGGGGDAVTRNAGFQQSCEAPPWTAPAITLPNNCNSNLGSETPPLVRSVSNASNLTSLNADLSLSDSHFFEVLYIGKVRISQRKVPETLIDDALHKLAQHEIEKAKNQRRHSLLSSTGTSVYSQDSSESINEKSAENVITFNKMTNLVASTTPLEPTKHSTWKSDEDLKEMKHNFDDEFDMFTKERVEKNNNIPTKTDTQTPLETTNLTINVSKKKNLGTVSEDEESPEESPKPNENDQNPLNTVLKIVEDGDVNKNTTRPKLERKPSVDDSESRLEKITENVPVGKIKFEEISRKPNASNSNKMNDMNENRRNSMPENKPFLRDRSASIGTINSKTPISHLLGEQNRTMLFQVGRSELRLISPDRKQILLHRALPDVASVVAGRAASDHLGVVCREPARTPAGGPPSSGPPAGGPPASGPPAGYACYVFRCESNAVTKELVAAIKQAFAAHAELMKKSRERSSNQSCEHCPLLWFHRLCHDVEGMTEKRIHAFILRRIEQLPEDEQDSIITKYQGGTNHMYETNEHNAFLMMLLRAHCEAKQLRHVHDTAENRSEFLNQYLGGSTIFMKAKRSLSNSFDHLLKRRASRDDHINVTAVKKESPPPPLPAPPAAAARSSQSPAIISDTSEPSLPPQRQDSTSDEAEEPPATSPIMDIFLKVSDSRPAPAQCGSETDAGWRQALYQQAVQPVASDGTNELSRNFLGDPQPAGKRSREQLRQLWRLAIDQTVLLIRMEKENNRLKESEEHSALRRIKLEYAELQAAGAGAAARWEDALQRRGPADATMLAHAVRQGVPRGCRGAVWYFLAEQAARRLPPPAEAPLYRAPYKALLAKLTKHQHAILIDLGRTFPQHSYFASALGPGQLALYNVLKAYSILDPEVGYCQGLSFVAAVLLLHLDEPDAFALLRHLMFRRGLRNQYLPDMSALQVQLYQLSRLLRDAEPELHERLRALDVPASLYAAPWMLTLFTAHFPLGFVVAVFDLIFLDSLDVVFSVSLALLSVHKDGLMLCESCEEAAEYLKHKLPDVDKNIYEKVMKKVHSLDVSRQLREYAAEYRVLREQVPAAAALQADRDRLAADARRLADQLDMAMDTIGNYQASQARLETQNKMMEQQLALLSRYVSAHAKHDAPNEVKKILQTYNKKTSFGSKIFSSKFSSNEEEESEKKIFKTGTSAPNLFAKISKDEVMNAINKEKNSPEKTEQLDRKHFMMKKSQSMHSGLIANNLRNYPLKVLDEKYERSDSFKSDGILADSLKEIGKKNSGYFASTHEQIRQERMFEQQLKHDFDENLKKLDERLAPNSHLNDLNIFQSKKSMSLNLIPTATVNDLKSNDSGFVTPLSPNEKERKHETTAVISHPLSDVDADIKFDGHSTILKQIRPLRNNSISLDTKHA